MRPRIPGGNGASASGHAASTCFNEAAGFTRRKPAHGLARRRGTAPASMRPPDLPGGNGIDEMVRAARMVLLQ